jgi:hypothetical protein
MGALWIRVSYSALLAVILALTAIFGVTMAFAGPKPPDTPSLTFRQIQGVGDNEQDTDRVIGVVDRFYQDAYDFRRAYPGYQRNLLMAGVILAIIFGAIGLALPVSFNYLRLGLVAGSIIVLIWASNVSMSTVPNPAPIGSGSVTSLLAAGSPPGLDFAGRFLRFAVAFIGLLVFLFLGLWRLTEWAPFASPQAAPASSTSTVPAAAPERTVWGRPENER